MYPSSSRSVAVRLASIGRDRSASNCASLAPRAGTSTSPRHSSSPSQWVNHGFSSRRHVTSMATTRSPCLSVFNHHIRHPHQQQHQVRSIFIQTEETPNPESVKFVPTGVRVLDNGDDSDFNGYFVNKTDAQDAILKSPLAHDLFQIDGVKSVYLGRDFVTITKRADREWRMLNPQIMNALMVFFDKGVPALRDQPLITDTTILEDDDEIVAMVKELIESRIRPAVQEDGGDIRYVGFEEETGIVTVELAGSCVGCPSSSVTLKQGVENMLMHYIPEVKAVVALEEEASDDQEGEVVVEKAEEGAGQVKQKTYEERLKAAGIPFSD